MKLINAIKNRWSPRSFSDKPVTGEMIDLLFEAARWAPSARNEQPWVYFYATKNDGAFQQLLNLLIGNNQTWAKNAQVLMISVVKKNYDYKGRQKKNELHDLGVENVSIEIQAAEMGLQIHQMGGFDVEKASEFLQLNAANFIPVTAIAVGWPGEPENLPDDLKFRELEPRSRNEIKSFVTKLK